MLKVGSDFSGVGAFDQALRRLGIQYKTVFSCDRDKYARQTYIANYGEPEYYPDDVYSRDIPTGPLDIYMTSPPCQAFSLAGKRNGESDDRGVLFYNSHEFIDKNRPRFFIFENVKGLLSDDKGRTFQRWLDYLGGKSVNGNPLLFPHDESVPYHVYCKVLNAKNHGVPQNRERVFIVGIRDDADNHFRWPIDEPLKLRLRDVLEDNPLSKYILSEKMMEYMQNRAANFNSGKINYKSGDDIASYLNANSGSLDISDNIIIDEKYYLSDAAIKTLIMPDQRDNGHKFETSREVAKCVRVDVAKNGTDDNYIKVNSATSSGYELAQNGDSINFSQPKSETRRGRVGKGVAQTLDTACNQAVVQLNPSKESGGQQPYKQNRVFDAGGLSPALDTECGRPSYKMQRDAIRRLTPRECFRLMDFPDSFEMPCSDTQMYRQAGNSIVVSVLASIINRLNITT